MAENEKKEPVKEQRQSVLKGFSAIYQQDGVTHDFYAKDNKNNYKFTLNFENGDVGTGYAQDTKGSNSWVVGEEHKYTKQTTEYNGNNYVNFYGVKAKSKEFNKGGYNKKKTKAEYKTDMISYGMRYAADLIVAGKADIKDTVALGERFTLAMWATLEKVEGLE